MVEIPLISSPVYYDYRRLNLFLGLFTALPLLVFINYGQVPCWLLLVAACALIAIYSWKSVNQSKISELTRESKLQFHENGFELLSEDAGLLMDVLWQEQHQVTLSFHEGLPMDSLRNYLLELAGRPDQNYIEVVRGGQKYRFDFDLNSYFKIRKFNTLLETWSAKGYSIQRI